ncbi:MAG: hypothetical protein GOVbin631_30 [Prokaryotic dsDNA virus sp.]|nr:MAG: hypothetical protein GOVbin631_30 [Prokaryotic dsDNA virus sp.]|tara:strand:- start:12682 stop:12858 length:177 start_codon:yes stop_codon:yes gene_type:complete
MKTELLRKVTKVHTSDGVYDGSMCHQAADEIEKFQDEIVQYEELVTKLNSYIKNLTEK